MFASRLLHSNAFGRATRVAAALPIAFSILIAMGVNAAVEHVADCRSVTWLSPFHYRWTRSWDDNVFQQIGHAFPFPAVGSANRATFHRARAVGVIVAFGLENFRTKHVWRRIRTYSWFCTKGSTLSHRDQTGSHCQVEYFRHALGRSLFARKVKYEGKIWDEAFIS